MASASDDETLFDEFLARRGHETGAGWEESYNKKQCPDCGGIHDQSATECTVCGWSPYSG
jgi:hypothetical protein